MNRMSISEQVRWLTRNWATRRRREINRVRDLFPRTIRTLDELDMFLCIVELHFWGKPASQKELRLHWQGSRSAYFGFIKRLEKRKYIRLVRDHQDKRAYIIELMPKNIAVGSERCFIRRN